MGSLRRVEGDYRFDLRIKHLVCDAGIRPAARTIQQLECDGHCHRKTYGRARQCFAHCFPPLATVQLRHQPTAGRRQALVNRKIKINNLCSKLIGGGASDKRAHAVFSSLAVLLMYEGDTWSGVVATETLRGGRIPGQVGGLDGGGEVVS